jgi:hypothetical protein
MPIVHHAIDVAASPDACWRVFADLASWPAWFPFLRAVQGELRSGGRLTLSIAAGPTALPLRITVDELVPGQRVSWRGSALGVTGCHRYEFETRAPGLTRVTSHEEFTGLGARLIAGPVFNRFDGEVHQSMARFKALVEATHA